MQKKTDDSDGIFVPDGDSIGTGQFPIKFSGHKKLPYTIKQLLRIPQLLKPPAGYIPPSGFEPIKQVLYAAAEFEDSCLIGLPHFSREKSDLRKSYDLAKEFHNWFLCLRSNIRKKLESEYVEKTVGPIFHMKTDPPKEAIKLRPVDIGRAVMDARAIYFFFLAFASASFLITS